MEGCVDGGGNSGDGSDGGDDGDGDGGDDGGRMSNPSHTVDWRYWWRPLTLFGVRLGVVVVCEG